MFQGEGSARKDARSGSRDHVPTQSFPAEQTLTEDPADRRILPEFAPPSKSGIRDSTAVRRTRHCRVADFGGSCAAQDAPATRPTDNKSDQEEMSRIRFAATLLPLTFPSTRPSLPCSPAQPSVQRESAVRELL